mmetsp:Transcript_24980/g.68892  ORF Transcript_24980/g.68892 Transcript_24980/m.68892 type:complete len:204 (+) Transcript_24980:401-1012(+)
MPTGNRLAPPRQRRNRLQSHGCLFHHEPVQRPPVAPPVPDGRKETPLSLHTMPGNPRPLSGPLPGSMRGEDDLLGYCYRSRMGHLRHVRPVQGGDGTGGRIRQGVPLGTARSHQFVPSRPGGRGTDQEDHFGTMRHLERAEHRRERGLRVQRDGGVLVHRRSDCRAGVRLGPLRSVVFAAEFPIRRNGKPVPHLCHADPVGRG